MEEEQNLCKNISIVGLGWLGEPLAEELIKLEYNVNGTTTSSEKIEQLKQKNIPSKVLNLNESCEDKLFEAYFKNSDVCIITIPPNKTLFQSYQNQCLKLVQLFPNKTKFIFTSSTSVYSDEKQFVHEDSKIISDYNFNSQLFITEKTLQRELKERLTILRLGGLFGPNRNPAKFLSGKQQLLNADSPVNLVHIHDVIAFIITVLDKNSWGEIYNVCSSDHPSRKDFYTWKCLKDKIPVPLFDDNSNNVVKKIVSNFKGKTILNFEYTYDSPFDY